MPIITNVDLTIYVFALFGCGKYGVCQNCVPVSQDKIFLPITILVPDVDHCPWSFFLQIGNWVFKVVALDAFNKTQSTEDF